MDRPKLLHSNGAPIGISFRRHSQNPNSFVIRIIGKGEQTDIGANPACMAECYEKAVDKRLAFLGLSDDANAFATLASAYAAFLRHYGIEIQPVINYEFNITKGN